MVKETVVVIVVLTLMSTMSVNVTIAKLLQQELAEDLQAVMSGCTAPLITFGASMLDVGEQAVLLPNFSEANFPPYGMDYFKSPAGRFSNGRVITDFISLGLGYGLLDNYLSSVEPWFAHGVNFACGGSTARNSTQSGSVTSALLPFDVQVGQYKLFKAKVRKAQAKHGGHVRYLPTLKALSSSIHIINHAHNDYTNTIRQAPAYDPQAVVASVIEAMRSSLLELYRMRARTMIVMNVLPLGCTPSLLAMAETASLTLDKDLCVTEYNSLVDLHNLQLQQLIGQLRVELAWNELVIFDLNAMYIDAIRHPSKYGVEYPWKACCGVGGKYNMNGSIPCGSKGTMNGMAVEARRCSSPTKYISWDGSHPTESFAKYIATALLNGQYFHPGFSMQDACKGRIHGGAAPSSVTSS